MISVFVRCGVGGPELLVNDGGVGDDGAEGERCAAIVSDLLKATVYVAVVAVVVNGGDRRAETCAKLMRKIMALLTSCK